MCWVRPGVFDANASPFWLVRMLMAVDLPAFERPAKAISGACVSGKSRSWLTVVKKRACQSLDMGWGEMQQKGANMLESYCTMSGYEVLPSPLAPSVRQSFDKLF